jgi:hypothetical protein
MRTIVTVALVLLSLGFAAVPARSDQPEPQSSALPGLPNGTVPAPGYSSVVQCAPKTRCLTADMLPIGTPVKVLVTGYMVGKNNEHPEAAGAWMLPAEDVIVNGRLVILKGVAGRRSGGGVPAFTGPCGTVTVAAIFVWTQDIQYLPISFGDPRTGAPNVFTFPMSREGIVCKRSDVAATAYISGPPALVPPKP